MKTIDTIRSHKRVREVTIEQGGDLIMVQLAKGWNRYGRCSDGYSKGFDRDNGDTVTDALNWVRREVHQCDDPRCPRCRPETDEDKQYYGAEVIPLP
ncbi:hypothetical protein [Sphingobium sp. MK2]|uniref:hypothetical protein n=1 Tax=Sphingobium sp. MK2 TaxID=3116540 RepID=UPI0032E366AD